MALTPLLRACVAPVITTGAVTSDASTAVDDLIVFVGWAQGTDQASISVPLADATHSWLNHPHNDGTTDGRFLIAVKVATVSGAQSYTPWTITGHTAGEISISQYIVQAGTYDPAIVASLPAANVSAASGTTNAVPNSPQLTPLTGLDYLFLSMASWHITAAGTTDAGAPTNYTMRGENNPAASHVTHLAITDRTMLNLQAAENPGGFTDNVAPNGTVACTLCIPGLKILGTSSITEAGDTVSSTASSEILGTASITEAGDTVSSAADVSDADDITCAANITEAGDTVTSTASSEILATVNRTEAGDTVSSIASSEILGTASITEAGDTSIATASSEIAATANITEAGDTVTSTAAVDVDDIEATANITEAGDTVSSIASSEILGTASITEAGDTSIATASSEILATVNRTEAGDTVSSTASSEIAATANITEAGDTVSSTASSEILGTASITEEGDTVSSTCNTVGETLGTVSITEADDTVDAYAFWLMAVENTRGNVVDSLGSSGIKVGNDSATGVVLLVNDGKVR